MSMPDANPHSKPSLEMIERQRVMMQEVKAAIAFLARAIAQADAEGIILAEEAAGFQRAELRGDTPDPRDIDRVVSARQALVQRVEVMNGFIEKMGQQAEAVTQAADACLFEELSRQFKAQFNIEEGR
jgi:hypothetical protein